MKVLINRVPKYNQPYGGGNLFLIELCNSIRAAGHSVVHQFETDIDRIFIMDPRINELGIVMKDIALYKQNNQNVIVAHRVNECDARKGTTGMDELLQNVSAISDKTAFVSHWMQSYHMNKWACDNTTVIINGVDGTIFKHNAQQSNITRIVSHHWSDNFYKGQHVYEWLDAFAGANPNFSYTYIGRTKANLKQTKIISPLFGVELGNALADHDVYVSGSMHDPGPNHILEALACELPTYVSALGGGAVEFAGLTHAYSNADQLYSMLMDPVMNKCSVLRAWSECIADYFELLELR